MRIPRIAIISIFTLLFLSCNKPAENSSSVASTKGLVDFIPSFDGVSLAYQVHGRGKQTLVFVHGWCCNRTYWDAQVPHFSQQYTVVTIDLAGHGESGLERENWSMTAFGRDVVAVVEKLNLNDVILVGHSMGGPVTVEAARLMPSRIKGLVGVDSFSAVEYKYTPAQIEAIMSTTPDNFVEATANKVRNHMFTPQSDPELIEKIVTDLSSAPHEVGIGAQKAIFNWYTYECAESLPTIQAPMFSINSSMHPVNIETMQRYTRAYKIVYMENVGHFIMMEDPETFNDHLTKIINELTDENESLR
jgi:pimeloyl-ACP methyl ester carboxylesterase